MVEETHRVHSEGDGNDWRLCNAVEQVAAVSRGFRWREQLHPARARASVFVREKPQHRRGLAVVSREIGGADVNTHNCSGAAEHDGGRVRRLQIVPPRFPSVIQLAAFGKRTRVKLGIMRAQEVARGLERLVGCRDNFCAGRKVGAEDPGLEFT